MLALFDWSATQVFAVNLNQVEGAQDGDMVVTSVAQKVKDRQAALIDNDGFAINEAGPHREVRNRFADPWAAVAEIITVAGVEPHAHAIPPCHDAEAVMLDLVYPIRPGWRELGRRWQARSDEADRAVATRLF